MTLPGTKSIQYFLVSGGPMSSAYNASVLAVAGGLVGEGYKVTTLDYNINPYSPVGCEWHPSVPVHAAMAAKVQPVIAKVMGWE